MPYEKDKYGYIDFSKLWEYMEKKGLKKQDLINNGIHKATIYKLAKNENVTCEVLAKLCFILKCKPNQILDYTAPES